MLAVFIGLVGAVDRAVAGGVGYSRIAVTVGSPHDLVRLGEAGIPLEEVRGRDLSRIVLIATPAEIARLRNLGFAVTTLERDVAAGYARRAVQDAAARRLQDSSRARNFHLGSLGGFLTLTELEAEFNAMQTLYPLLISAWIQIGTSVEGRPIWAVKISRNPQDDEDEPRVLYTAMHHAREPQGMMVLLHTMWYLLEQYGINSDVTEILDHRELYFVPVVNPDGYYYNEATAPAGGGLWRKNRRRNANGTFGVDLNRNYGFAWGADNTGSSPQPDYETFRGTAPFSEPETQAVRDFCLQKKFSLALNYHTFGDVLIHPWGYSAQQTPDSSTFRRLADIITARNYYAVGTGLETLGYRTNGDSDDWMYGDTLTKPVIFAMTPEVGGDDDGFWPAPTRILPLAEAHLEANLRAAELAGDYYRITSPQIDQKRDRDTITVSFVMQNAGVKSVASGFTAKAEGEGIIIAEPRSIFVSGVSSLPIVFNAVRVKGLPDGFPARLSVEWVSPKGRSRDSVQFRLGVPTVLFADNADSGTGKWVSVSTVPSSRWDTTSTVAFSGRSFTDSRAGAYARNVVNTLTLGTPVPLNAAAADLHFRARWEIEPAYDAVVVEASTDLGVTWIPLRGRFARPGSGLSGSRQQSGLPVYDRTKWEWVNEIIDLEGFLTASVLLRFRMESDAFVQRDGMYVDDIMVLGYRDVQLAVAPAPLPGQVELYANYPNPFNGQTTIRFSIPFGMTARLQLTDVLGRNVITVADEFFTAGLHTRIIDARVLASGVYYYSLETAGGTRVRPALLIR